ncbi:MAG: excinuclease ABC subunit UvrC [Alphaproteobacteria bacterium]|nr:excinuclease ABC subunit UvrC [Alphaproteobacteria bacterium]
MDQPASADTGGDGAAVSLAAGIELIRRKLRTMPGSPGVYRMIGGRGKVLYVGKARNLKKRVATYAHPGRLPVRLQRMVAETRELEIVTTHTEVEALLLEANLIKTLKPHFNILLRDDKSFADILIAKDRDFPQILKHRGARKLKGEYYGPFASAGAVNRTITALQRAFLLRNCSDSVFASRNRPCLQYQIKRCSAPCVGRVDKDGYDALVRQAHAFLTGRTHAVQAELARQMQDASEALEFERAGALRDRIKALTQIQSHQDINPAGIGNTDVIALAQEGGQSCVQVFFFRDGRNHGNRAYFPSHDRNARPAEIMSAFIGQFYDGRPAPKQILVSDDAAEADLLAEALAIRAGHRVTIRKPLRGRLRKPLEHAVTNARSALARRMSESASQRRLLEGLAETLALESAPERIEVYDNSHIQGENAVGAMIVAGPEGLNKAAYRKFNIRTVGGPAGDAAAGDDYAMMREVLGRRFSRALKEDPDREHGAWPDLVVIDGGPGQLSAAAAALQELGIEDIELLAIAKGPDRNAGRERLHRPGRAPFLLEPKDPVLYFLQRLRDEAHRFAIGTHRARRGKGITVSPLDEIPGIGARRKRALLQHFGSAKAVAQAGLGDLEAVAGISGTVARKIYGHFHDEG